MIKVKPVFKENSVNIILASSEYYSVYMAVLIQSIIENSSELNNYDIIILQYSMMNSTQEILRKMARKYNNISIRIYDMANAVDPNKLINNNPKASIDIYSSLFTPYILENYDKVVYLDSDIIVRSDIAELYNTDIEDNLMGAVRLAAMTAMQNSNLNFESAIYWECDFPIKNITNYCNTGVRIMNLKEFRKNFTFKKMFKLVQIQQFRIQEQDLLNIICEGRIEYLDPSWHFFIYTEKEAKNTIELLPEEYKNEYLEATSNRRLYHYTIPVKPWQEITEEYKEFSTEFWEVARRSPFYETILLRMMEYSKKRHKVKEKYFGVSWKDFRNNKQSKKIIVIGLGDNYREFIYWHKNEFKIEAIIDIYNKDVEKRIEDIPIYSIDVLYTYMFSTNDVMFLITENEEEIMFELGNLGYHNYYSYKHLQKRVPYMQIPYTMSRFNEFKETLYEKYSREIADTIISRKINYNGNTNFRDIYEKNPYYNEVLKLSENEVYVDIGSYNGYTIKQFLKNRKNRFKKIYAFEMDLYNFKKLKEIKQDNIQFNNIALGDSDKEVYYSSAGYFSTIVAESSNHIQCKKLDSIIFDEITFIKLNVPGWDMLILKGAEQLIKKYKPKLAICISNKWDDLWEIPIWIHNLVPEYKLYIRHHSTTFEGTVLYAII